MADFAVDFVMEFETKVQENIFKYDKAKQATNVCNVQCAFTTERWWWYAMSAMLSWEEVLKEVYNVIDKECAQVCGCQELMENTTKYEIANMRQAFEDKLEWTSGIEVLDLKHTKSGKSHVCANKMYVQETNFSFTQFYRRLK